MQLTLTISQGYIMIKLIILNIILTFSLFGIEIPLEHSTQRTFGKSVKLNGQIVQLSNASQSVMSQVDGHIEKYFVKIGQNIKKGQKIVLLESIVLSQMTADFISQKKQLNAQQKNYTATKLLYDKGMASMVELNTQSIKRDEFLAKLNTLKSQLSILGINTSKLKKASPNFILYAHSDGVVSEILQALHSNVNIGTPIISVVKNNAFYLKSYLPLKYAHRVKVGQKIVIKYHSKNIISYITQILPNVDEKTQRIILLSSIDEKVKYLYINAYTSAELYFDTTKKYVAIKKSALSFFNNEWVVFVPKEQKEHEGHDGLDEHEEHKHEGLEVHKEDKHNGHKEHDENGSDYEPRVVKILTQDEEFIAIEGLELGEEYVSDKSYYVKSSLLKSSLGGHGH